MTSDKRRFYLSKTKARKVKFRQRLPSYLCSTFLVIMWAEWVGAFSCFTNALLTFPHILCQIEMQQSVN